MESIFVSDYVNKPAKLRDHLKKVGRVFAIGVKGDDLDIDQFATDFNVEKLGEVYNPKYINPDYYPKKEMDTHILQPAFISLKG